MIHFIQAHLMFQAVAAMLIVAFATIEAVSRDPGRWLR